MANTPKDESNKIERRDFLKKTGTVAGVIAAGFPGIISAQTVTNAVKVGLVGTGGRAPARPDRRCSRIPTTN